LLNEET
jgi:serine/threonine protein kinase